MIRHLKGNTTLFPEDLKTHGKNMHSPFFGFGSRNTSIRCSEHIDSILLYNIYEDLSRLVSVCKVHEGEKERRQKKEKSDGVMGAET